MHARHASKTGGELHGPQRLGLAGAVVLALFALGASPDVALVTPRGGQRGTELDLVLHGQRLKDAAELLFYTPGITVTNLTARDKEVTAHVKIAADARLGEYALRLRSESGISELRTFWVSPFPIVTATEADKNHSFEHPRKIDLNTTVAGTVQSEAADYYVVEAKKGQRLSAEVAGMRLGSGLFDPYVAILNTARFELAVSDDTAFARTDPVASAVVPEDGSYIVQVRESSYGGGPQCAYLMHVGTFPRPTTTFPLGGRSGEDLALQFIGDVQGIFVQPVKLPDTPADAYELFAEQNGLSSPTPNRVRVASFPNVMEVEPNHEIAQATPANIDAPLAFNGVISKPSESDFFRFKAKKNEALHLRVVARVLRSPLDSVLHLYDHSGREMAGNDDAGSPDSYLRFSPPADGEYVLGITDQLHRGGADFTYRIEVTRVEPGMSITLPQVAQNSQERQSIAVPRGNRFATLVRVTRTDFGGEVALASPDMPPGVTMANSNLEPGQDVVPVVFEAAADAPIGGKLCEFTANPVDPNAHLTGRFEQVADLIVGPNNSTFYQARVNKLPIAATKEAPFKLHMVVPKVPVVQGGSMDLKVTAERAEGFKGPISLHMLFNPPGIGSSPQVEIPADKTEAAYPLSANDNAPVRKWKICIVGQADVGGPLWTASELGDLTVAGPFVSLKVPMTAIEQGKATTMTCEVTQREKFEGTATVKLLGLPPGVTTTDSQISSTDSKVTFDLAADAKSPPGQHPSLFCQVTVVKDGESIIHNVGRGGVLRIDAPRVVKTVVAAAPAAPAPPPRPQAPAEKPLSRLELLRQEQAAQKEAK